VRWNFRQKRIEKKKSIRPIYQNPLFAKKNWQIYVIERFSFFGWLGILLFLLIIYILFYSPLLQITKIEISGTNNISAQTLEEKYIKWQLKQNKWKIFKQNNILLFSKKWLRDNIEEKYSLDSLEINKKIPHTLSVTIEEKTPTLIWTTNDLYYYLDESGFIASLITDQESITNLPAIHDEGKEAVKIGQEILTKEKVLFIKELISDISHINSIEVTSYSIPHHLSTQINVHVSAGYQIYFDSQKNLDTQIDKLKRVLEESETAKSAQEYIDLRIGERVYIK